MCPLFALLAGDLGDVWHPGDSPPPQVHRPAGGLRLRLLGVGGHQALGGALVPPLRPSLL
jgi:hypothetical protein